MFDDFLCVLCFKLYLFVFDVGFEMLFVVDEFKCVMLFGVIFVWIVVCL